MNKKNAFRVTRVRRAIFAVSLALVLSACATAPVTMDASEEVRGLAQSRWDALVRGDVTAAYGFMSPASRALMSLLQYQQRIRVGFWRRVEVEAVSCGQDVCNVSINITYDHGAAKGVVSPSSETWVKEGGKWWFAQK